MAVDAKIIDQRTRERLNDEYQMSISDEGLKSQGVKERYAVIYKEEFDKEEKKQSSNLPVPVSKPVITACSGNQQPTQGKKDPNIKCNFSSVTVEKAGRKYTLKIDKNTPSGENVLEIVAGPYINTQDVTVTVNGLEGPCIDGHKNKVMDLVNPKPISKSDTVLKFKAASFYYIPFVDSLWPSGAPWKTYDIPISTCNGKKSAIIKVYPDIEYDFKINFNPNKTSKGFHNGVFQLDKEGVELKITGSVKQDTVQLKFEKKFESVIKAISTASTFLQQVKKMTSTFNSSIEIEYKYVNLDIGVKGKWIEIEGSPKCGYECKFDMGMNPVFGIGVSVDALGIAIESIPGFGVILGRIKKYFEKSGIGKIKLTLKLNGEISCNFIGIKKVTQKNIEATACDTSGEITAGVKGEISLSSEKYSGDTFAAEAGAEAGGEAKIKLGAKIVANDKQKIDIYYGFNGLEFSYAAYIKASGGIFEFEKKSEGKAKIFEAIEDKTITTINLNNK